MVSINDSDVIDVLWGAEAIGAASARIAGALSTCWKAASCRQSASVAAGAPGARNCWPRSVPRHRWRADRGASRAPADHAWRGQTHHTNSINAGRLVNPSATVASGASNVPAARSGTAVSNWCVPAVARRPTTPQEAEPLSFRKLYRGRPNFALPQYEGKRRYSSQRGGTFRKHGAGEMRAIIWRADLRLHAHLGDAAEARYPLPCEQSPEHRPRPPAMLARLYCQPPPTRSQSRGRIMEADHGQTKLDDLPQN